MSFYVEAEAAEEKFWNLEGEAEAIEKKFSVFKVEAEAMKNFSIKWKRKRKLWNFFSQNGSGSGSAITIYRFQNTVIMFNFVSVSSKTSEWANK